MQFLIAGVLGFMMVTSMVGKVLAMRMDHPVDAAMSVATVDQYRMFMYSATQYMAQSGLPAISTATPVAWATIATSPLTPPGARNLAMPVNWHIVRSTDGSWVACTDMDERAVAAVQQLAPTGSKAVYQGGVVSSVVIGASDSTTAQTQAALCSI